MSSNSSVPMEPAPPSLVERLRNKNLLWTVPGALREEAAERIEELEQTIWTMHGEANEYIKRIEALEAVLQEIGKTNSYAGILARRALEGKS